MAVSVTVDEPDIEITVTNYDGYTEAGGVSVPVAVGDVQVQKGPPSVAGGLTVPVAVGNVQSAKGAQSAAQGLTTSVSVGNGQSQKGDASVADGLVAGTSVGDVSSQKGDATQAQGLSAPVVLGDVQTDLRTARYIFDDDLRKATATLTGTEGTPQHYTHAVAYDGTDLSLTTS